MNTMSTILENIGTFVSSAIEWMQTFLYSIVGGTIGTGESAVTYSAQPVLIIFVICLPLVGLGIGLLRRIIHTRG